MKIKDLLCSEPILAIFNLNAPTIIYTDASMEGLGAVLKQKQPDGEQKPVGYFSKKLNKYQKKKKAIFLECLAIKEAIKYWQYWLLGKKFLVITDHKPLEGQNIRSRTDEELGNLTYYLSQYDFETIYHPGKDNLEADCLSRNPVLECQEDEEDQLKIVNLIKIEDIYEDQKKNEGIKTDKDKLYFKENLYYKRINKKEKIVLSEEFCKKLIENTHKHFCHIGMKQMQRKILPYYTARNISKNIERICKNCKI